MTEKTAILSRMFLVFGLLLLIPCVLAFQLVRINYFEGEELRLLWSKQAIDSIPIPAQRGNIYDANGTLLATNAANYLIALDPKVKDAHGKSVSNEQINELSSVLAKETNNSASYYRKRISEAPSNSQYIVLAKNLSPISRDAIRELDIKGVIIEESFSRKYTFGSLAAHSLGFVNHNMDGKTGLEAYYDEDLKGENGVQQVRRDPRNQISAYIGAPKKLPENGRSIHTTIDSYIQAILEDELKKGVDKHLAEYGTGIIIDPKTGAIKALANYPTYDPNYPGSDENENRRNFAISDMVEPGSTFKLVTAIAAVEQNKVDFEEIFETPESGEVVIHGLTLRDHDPLGNMTFQEVIQKSSNVATAEIAMRLKPQVFYQYARNLGFGSETNIDLSGEVAGILNKPYDWSMVSLPWMSHGYEILATPLQVAQAYAAFANEGLLMRPYLVDRIEDQNGNIVLDNKPVEIRRVARKKTLQKILPIFESVVTDSGTGEWAQIDGLRIAGKTGTAKKVYKGRYSNKYLASFVGFFPAEDPKYVCLIILNEPKTSGYGGFTAGPIFRETAKRIAGLDGDIQRSMSPKEQPELITKVPSLIGISKERSEELLKKFNLSFKTDGKSGYVIAQNIEPGTPILNDEGIILTLSETYLPVDSSKVKEGFAEVPELRGMSMRQATNILSELGLKAASYRSGTIERQFPKAGDMMKLGSAVTIRGKAKPLELVTKKESD
ncbi:MAG: penicillin-binding transpeptidase domain-containing protein [Balneola sp.]